MAAASASQSDVIVDYQSMNLFYDAFRKFLAVDSAFQESNKRRSQSNRAQQKLLRLSAQQFHELSTDVYDELLRRINHNDGDPEFLRPRDNFHPKRNQARQKLSLLSSSRFNDLSFDILFEIERRLNLNPGYSPEGNNTQLNQQNSQTNPQSTTNPNTPFQQQQQQHQQQPYQNINAPRSANDETYNNGPYQNNQHLQDQQQQQIPQNSRFDPSYSPQTANNNINNSQDQAPQNKPTTKTITPAKSTLVEMSDDEYSDYSEVDDHHDELFPKTGNENKSAHDVVGAAAKAWADKNTSMADLTSMGSTQPPNDASTSGPVATHTTSEHSERYDDDDNESNNHANDNTTTPTSSSSSPQANIQPLNNKQQQQQFYEGNRSLNSYNEDEDDDEYQQNNFYNSDIDMHRTLPLQAIEEEKSPYIPPSLMKNINSSPPSNADRRQSLSEQISSSIVKSRSASKHDLELASKRETELQKQLSDSQNKVTALEAALKDKDEQIQMLVDEGSRMDESISKLENTLRESEALKESLVTENGRLHELIGEAEEAKDKALTELEETRKEFNVKTEKYITDLEDKQRALASLEIQHQKLKEKHSETISKQSEFAGSSASLSSQIMLLEGKLLKHESTISNLQDQLEKKQNQVLELEKTVAEKNEEISNLLQTIKLNEENENISKAQQALSVAAVTDDDVEKHEKYVTLLNQFQQLQDQDDKLRQELKQQQIVTEQVKQEASAFLEEMRTLAESESGWNSENKSKEIESLKKEVQEWKSRYSKAKAHVRNLRASSYAASPTAFPHQQVNNIDSSLISPTGKILDVSVTKFQLSMDDFLVKARTTSPKHLMDHLHNVVSATRVITKDVIENQDNSYKDDSQLKQGINLVTNTASHLITTTRNHSTSNGLSPMFLVDAAASDLASAVIELIRLAKIKPTAGNSTFNLSTNNEYTEREYTPVSTPANSSINGQSPQSNFNASPHTYDNHSPINTVDRKQKGKHHSTNPSASSSILQSDAATQSPSSTQSKHYSGHYTHTSTGSTSSKASRNYENQYSPSHGSANNHDAVNGRTSPHDSITHTRSISIDKPSRSTPPPQPKTQAQAQSRLLSEVPVQQQPRLQPPRAPLMMHSNSSQSSIMIDPEKKTVAELQEYLESQTVAVIDSIQELLTGIKGTSNYSQVRNDMTTVISTVEPVIDATAKSMTQTRNWKLRDLGKYILDSLQSCCERMSNLYTDSNPFDDGLIPDKQFKQRLAGISFDMARCTKELVKAVEEVSLNMEISEIDHELNEKN